MIYLGAVFVLQRRGIVNQIELSNLANFTVSKKPFIYPYRQTGIDAVKEGFDLAVAEVTLDFP